MVEGFLPEFLVPFRARYNGSCVCGRYIAPGQCVYKDRETDRLLCQNCIEVYGAENISMDANNVHAVLDRIAQIRALPAPLSTELIAEMTRLITQLGDEYAQTRQARTFFAREIGLSSNKDEYRIIATKFNSVCFGCKLAIAERTPALWCQASRKIWCLSCAADVVNEAEWA